MKPLFRVLALTAMAVGLHVAVGAAQIYPPQALASTEAFLELIDGQSYLPAYQSGSQLLRLSQSKQDWLAGLKRTRKLLGKIQNRELRAVRSLDYYTGLPDGEYLLVAYRSRTEFKANASEIVLLGKLNGGWRVCSYRLK